MLHTVTRFRVRIRVRVGVRVKVMVRFNIINQFSQVTALACILQDANEQN
jgi:hypothetical protein